MSDKMTVQMQAKHDQRQADACEKLFRTPAKFAVGLSKTNREALEIFGTDEVLMSWLLHYARLGHSATCLAVMNRCEENMEWLE